MVREGAGGKVVRRLPAVQELPSDQFCVYLEGKE